MIEKNKDDDDILPYRLGVGLFLINSENINVEENII